MSRSRTASIVIVGTTPFNRGKIYGDTEDIHRLAREEWTGRRRRLRIVVEVNIIVKSILGESCS